MDSISRTEFFLPLDLLEEDQDTLFATVRDIPGVLHVQEADLELPEDADESAEGALLITYDGNVVSSIGIEDAMANLGYAVRSARELEH